MQGDESMAQERRYEASDISAPIIKRTASLAVPSCSLRGDSPRYGQSQQCVVLLVRKENKGT